ncbi:MAG: hypothetical protein QXT81_02755 [Candidatus Bathyarchaeia archaeon]
MEIVLALLKKTCEGKKTVLSEIGTVSGYPYSRVRSLITDLASSRLLTCRGSVVDIDSVGRLRLAVEAVRNGARLEMVSRSLDFREFEEMSAEALRANAFKVYVRFIVKHGKRRYEIDIIGRRGPHMICIDCKHWGRGLSFSRLSEAVERQVERTEALAMELGRYGPRLGIGDLPRIVLVPALVTLADIEVRTFRRVPVIPVLRLIDFLAEFDLHLDSMLVIRRDLRESPASTG